MSDPDGEADRNGEPDQNGEPDADDPDGDPSAERDGRPERPLSAWAEEAGVTDSLAERRAAADDRPSAAEVLDLDDDLHERVRLGVELLARCEHESLSMKGAVDRIETVTTDPDLTRRILEVAEEAGAIEREDGAVVPQRGLHVNFAADVVRKEGDFECRRCGAGLSTGHFIKLESGELGAFGSSCIRTVTGRE